MSTKKFFDACATYHYLLDRGYPEKASLKLVADRHRLTRVERNSLFRGIVATVKAERRRAKLVAPGGITGENLGIDWYNVLITVESYLKGQPVFLCEDGVLRDSSGVHGSFRVTAITERARDEIIAHVLSLGATRIDVFVDAPVAFSGVIAAEVRERLAVASCQTTVELAHSADYLLKSYSGIVASSDSVVLDASPRVYDLARRVLETAFDFTPSDVHVLFPSDPEPPQRSPGS